MFSKAEKNMLQKFLMQKPNQVEMRREKNAKLLREKKYNVPKLTNGRLQILNIFRFTQTPHFKLQSSCIYLEFMGYMAFLPNNFFLPIKPFSHFSEN